jgi:hypothetical protein
MNTSNQSVEANHEAFRADATVPGGNSRSGGTASSIHYVGAKDPRVPMPFVILGLLLMAGAAVVFLRTLHP